MATICRKILDMVQDYKESLLTNPFSPRPQVVRILEQIQAEIEGIQGKYSQCNSSEKIALLGTFLGKATPLAASVHEVFLQQMQQLVAVEIVSCVNLSTIDGITFPSKKRPPDEDQAHEAKRQRVKEPELQKEIVPLKNGCAGIAKVENRCFAIAALKALWSSSGIRELIKMSLEQSKGKKQPLAIAPLSQFIAMMDATGLKDVLPSDHPLFLRLIDIGRQIPDFRDGKQQDAVEFFEAIVGNLLQQDQGLFTYTERNCRPKNLKFPCFIPGVDNVSKTSGTVFVLHEPGLPAKPTDFQSKLFSYETLEKVEGDSIIKADANQKMNQEYLKQLAIAISYRPIPVLHQKVFEGSMPLVLPIQVLRQIEPKKVDLTDARKHVEQLGIDTKGMDPSQIIALSGGDVMQKSHTPVKAPSFITVPHQDGKDYIYGLRSVVVHLGSAEGGGHYVTYVFPQNSDQAKESETVTRHDDAHVETIPFQAAAQKEIDENGYLYLYDLLQ